MSSEIHGQRILILGYGVEGQSVEHFLKSRYPEVKLSIADQNSDPDYLEGIANADTIVRSPGISAQIPELIKAKERDQWVTSATNLFFSHKVGRVVGITGTKGKSTTASLIATVLARRFSDVRLGGNIGKPLLDLLPEATSETIFVAELSSFQLEDCRFSPEVSVLLNIAPEHLDHHGTLEAYQAAKLNILAHQKSGDLLISNSQQPVCKPSAGKALSFGSPNDRVYLDRENMICVNGQRLISLQETSLRGHGNLQNMMAAASIGLAFDVAPQDIAIAFREFSPLPYRLEPIGTFKGIHFINDSLATEPESMLHAVEAFRDELGTLIAGGFDRGLNFSQVGQPLVASTLEHLILLPTTGAKIRDSVRNCGAAPRFTMHEVKSLSEAVSLAYKLTAPGRSCLLSPGAASFNMFKDYRERGDSFRSLVLEYSEKL